MHASPTLNAVAVARDVPAEKLATQDMQRGKQNRRGDALAIERPPMLYTHKGPPRGDEAQRKISLGDGTGAQGLLRAWAGHQQPLHHKRRRP